MTLLPGVKGAFGSPEYELDRQATAYKKVGNWESAISALRKRKALMGVRYDDTKLAKYCQAAGQFDDAMAEIQWLLDQAPRYAQAIFGHQPPICLQCREAGHRARIHVAAALICKRAKAEQLRAQHEAEAVRHGQEFTRLRPLERQAMKEQLSKVNPFIST